MKHSLEKSFYGHSINEIISLLNIRVVHISFNISSYLKLLYHKMMKWGYMRLAFMQNEEEIKLNFVVAFYVIIFKYYIYAITSCFRDMNAWILLFNFYAIYNYLTKDMRMFVSRNGMRNSCKMWNLILMTWF